jgi:hypothetical protein
MTWFYLHCVAALVIIVADYKGTLEHKIEEIDNERER